MRRPLASQTTDAGLGGSFTGQSGMGAGGGVWATGAVSCFFAVECVWDLRTYGLTVVGETGCEGDCAAPEMPETRVAARNVPDSIPHSKGEDGKMRDCGVANVRMAICSQGWFWADRPVLKRPTALDYQWLSNAHSVFRIYISGRRSL